MSLCNYHDVTMRSAKPVLIYYAHQKWYTSSLNAITREIESAQLNKIKNCHQIIYSQTIQYAGPGCSKHR